VRAILLDMDGTLVDSEVLTEIAITDLLRERGFSTDGLDMVAFHGIAWHAIARQLADAVPGLPEPDAIERDIEERFQALFTKRPPALLPGARDAVLAAAAAFPGHVTIVTGSEARAVDSLLDRADLHDAVTGYTCYGHYRRSKPHPECYLLAAERLGADPSACLVFEDSHPGLQAAAAAGMARVAVTAGVEARVLLASELADAHLPDLAHLPPGFFDDLAAGQELSHLLDA
jgi:HAD superfamily hydrolase (TIGR01509 family)